jgi:hypothetical protein
LILIVENTGTTAAPTLGVGGAAGYDNGLYIGHDEPSIGF